MTVSIGELTSRVDVQPEPSAAVATTAHPSDDGLPLRRARQAQLEHRTRAEAYDD